MRAQGYYQGHTSIWVPKQRLCTTNVGQKHEPKEPNNQDSPKSLTKMKQPTLYMWLKKENLTTAKKVIKMRNNQNKEPKKQVWVRKAQSTKSQDQQVKLSQQIKNIPSKEMQLRIAKLQALLFGMTSIKGTKSLPATNCHLILVK